MTDINIFEFGAPSYLLLIVVAVAVVVVYALMLFVRRRKLRRFGCEATLRELMPERSVARGWVKVALFACALVMLSLAAARPRTGSKLRSVESVGREIVLAVDVSRSMLAEDVKPSRMERTRYAISRLIEGIKEDRIGIVAFAGEAEVVLPITSDKKMAQAKVRALSPALIANQGTDVGAALELATLSFSSSTQNNRSRVVILITDGEDHDEGALAAAEAAAAEGITVCAIGIGTPEGVILEINGETIEDENGKMVLTKLNEPLLQQIAQTTNGIYTRSRNEDFGLEGIIAKLDSIEESQFKERTFEEYDEEYQWFVAAAIVLLLVEMLVLSRRNPLLAGIKLFERDTTPTTTTRR